jgi:imidazolonepropionase
MQNLTLIGPFSQLLTMEGLALRGSLSDQQLQMIPDAGILVRGDFIESVGPYSEMLSLPVHRERITESLTVVPGFVDAHTHICWAGTRAKDYAMRLEGYSYHDLASCGGGIWSTVINTRASSTDELSDLTKARADRALKQGVTTMEVKSGYGLAPQEELKILQAIRQAGGQTSVDLVPTCLAAHIKPKDFPGTAGEYLDSIIQELWPVIKEWQLCSRIDIYVDEGAFSIPEARRYLTLARDQGFQVLMHASQFQPGGGLLAVEISACSADHLESSSEEEIIALARSAVIPVALPGASMGLGVKYAPARRLLNTGASLAIASDWNPGSAPMGNLLMQSSVMGVSEKLTTAETFAAITFRAAAALGLNDRGRLQPSMLADFLAFPCADYREILYHQGTMMPVAIWKRGKEVTSYRVAGN